MSLEKVFLELTEDRKGGSMIGIVAAELLVDAARAG